jgi:putative ABC transport system ATP-binding protein
LNSTSANEIMRLLADIHRNGTTILLVTHDVKVAAKTGRVLFIYDGKIAGEYLHGVYDETRDDLKTREKDLTTWLDGMKF